MRQKSHWGLFVSWPWERLIVTCTYFVPSKCSPFSPHGPNTAQNAQITMTALQSTRWVRTSPIPREWQACGTWATRVTWMPSSSVSAAFHHWWSTFSRESTLLLFKSKTICVPWSPAPILPPQGEVREGTLSSPFRGLNKSVEAAEPQRPGVQPRTELCFPSDATCAWVFMCLPFIKSARNILFPSSKGLQWGCDCVCLRDDRHVAWRLRMRLTGNISVSFWQPLPRIHEKNATRCSGVLDLCPEWTSWISEKGK